MDNTKEASAPPDDTVKEMMAKLGLSMKDQPQEVREHVVDLCADISNSLVDAVLNEPEGRKLRWEQAAFAAGMAINGLIGVMQMVSHENGIPPPSKAEFASRLGDIIAAAVAHEISLVRIDPADVPTTPDTRH